MKNLTNSGNRLALCILDSEDNVLAVDKEYVCGYTVEAIEDLEKHHMGLDFFDVMTTAIAQEYQTHDLNVQIERLLREVHQAGEE